MTQTTFEDDDLFGEAASEMRTEVEEHLDAAREALPAADEVWEVEADNVLGVLNALRSALDAGDAGDHLRQAKKQFVLGERADAFDDADDLRAEIEELEGLLADLEAAVDQVGELTGTVPGIRSALQEAGGDAGTTDGGEEAEAAADGGAADDDE